MLSGVVDRLALHALLPLLTQQPARPGAPCAARHRVRAGGRRRRRDPAALDLVDGRPLHAATWELLLGRAGFVEVAPLAASDGERRPVRVGGRHALVSGIHHFVPVLHRGDAVGRHTLRLRDATRARGFRSEIYVDTVDPDTEGETVPVLAYAGSAERGDVVVYQFATASAMAPWLAGRSETLVVNYHNITPPDLMAPWDNHLALGQLRAQGDLRLLAPRTALAVADSAYNEAHLAGSGFAATAVIPPVGRARRRRHRGARAARLGSRRRPAGRGARWLAVGRVSPNKALESTVAALAVARAHGDPGATPADHREAGHGVATSRPCSAMSPSWAWPMRSRSPAMPATPAVAAAYGSADVLVVTSEHEGFCVPVVEAMSAGLPVVAFDQGAVPEVLGDAGVLVSDKDPYALAAAITRPAGRRAAPRRRSGEAGRRRLAELDLESAADRFVDLLAPLGAPGARAVA